MFGLLLNLLIGLLICFNGSRIWIKRSIQIIHGNARTKIRDEDIPFYARAVGLSLIIVGLGIVIAGISAYFGYAGEGYILLGVLFVIALAIFIRAQKKYNA